MPFMITHLVLFTWKPGTDPADVARLQHDLTAFAAKLPGCTQYLAGPSVGLRPGADFGIVGVFETEEAWRAYIEHPAHLRIVQEQIVPIAETRQSTQLRS